MAHGSKLDPEGCSSPSGGVSPSSRWEVQGAHLSGLWLGFTLKLWMSKQAGGRLSSSPIFCTNLLRKLGYERGTSGSLLSLAFLVGPTRGDSIHLKMGLILFSFLEFATFLALVLARRWEGVTVRDSLGPLLSLVSLLVEEGNFVQAAHSPKSDCLNCFPGCLPS